ncbi:hypothetical protein ES703_68779 [subsurface metagenome]
MSVVRDLERCRSILLDISEREDCAELTHYNGYSVKIFVGGLERAIKRYKSEAKRVKKYYKG